LMKRLAGEGKTVIVISHEMPFVAETADDVLVMKNGQVLTRGTTVEVFREEDVLRKAMIELPQITQLARRLGFEGVLTIGRLLDCLSASQITKSEGVPS